MTRHPMDSPKKLNPTWTLKSSQMSWEEYSADTQAVSEVLAKNCGNLTLNPSTKLPSLLPECSPEKQERGTSLQGLGLGLSQGMLYKRRHGVRTLATSREKRMQRMLQMIRYRTLSLVQKDPQEMKLGLSQIQKT